MSNEAGFKTKTREERIDRVIELFDKCILDAASIIKVIKDEYKEPCAHEPFLPVHYAVNGAVSIEAYQDLERALMFPKCKCGARLKMEGKWVEV